MLSGRLVVVEGRLADEDEERCEEVVGRLPIVGRLLVVAVERLVVVVVGRTLLLLPEDLTLLLLLDGRDDPAVLAPLGVLLLVER